jgi:cation:H+ antiporter
MEYIQLIAGLIILIISGDYLVKGGVSLARHFKISTLVVGLTVVAFGTSAPELIVSFDAAITNHHEIAIGNVIGSNIANIALVLALTVTLMSMPVKSDTIRFGWPVMFLSSILFFIFISNSQITNIEGITLSVILVAFIWFSIRRSRKRPEAQIVLPPRYKLGISLAIIILSCVGLTFGAKFLIVGASTIARNVGVSERVISITMVAFGTSLPELVASITAAIKKESDISIGNIIGSNIFNILAVIGFTSSAITINVDYNAFEQDIIWMLLISFLLLLFIIPALPNLKAYISSGWKDASVLRNLEGGRIHRFEGLLLFILYVVYVTTLFTDSM